MTIARNCRDPFRKLPEELKRYIFLHLSTNEVIYLEKVPTYGDLVEFTPESRCSRAWPERGVLRCFEHDQERLTSRRWEQFHHAAGRLSQRILGASKLYSRYRISCTSPRSPEAVQQCVTGCQRSLSLNPHFIAMSSEPLSQGYSPST